MANSCPATHQILRQQGGTGEDGHIHLVEWTFSVVAAETHCGTAWCLQPQCERTAQCSDLPPCSRITACLHRELLVTVHSSNAVADSTDIHPMRTMIICFPSLSRNSWSSSATRVTLSALCLNGDWVSLHCSFQKVKKYKK